MKLSIDWLENPEIFQVSRMPAHSDHHYYATEVEWLQGKESMKQSLNGEWKFAWYNTINEVPEPLENWGTNLHPTDTIQVPGHIELQGYGQIQYVNTSYPWDGHTFLRPPMIDHERNPIGFYAREFDLEEGLKYPHGVLTPILRQNPTANSGILTQNRNKRIYISFQGADKAIYVWLNGEFIGYSEDSCTPSEFDISDYVQEKNNRLCVAVFKNSSASWLEDQDFFRFSGLFREVFLYAKPEVHIDDLDVKASLGEGYQGGKLSAKASVSCGEGNTGSYKISYELLDHRLEAVSKGELKEAGQGHFTMEESFDDVRQWSPEQPYLYTFLLKVMDNAGKVIEVVPYKIGFRSFELKDKVMFLNGKRLLINGVNRHEWSAEAGRAITAEDMRKDIEIFKKNNINAVRTSHYPNQSLWYELCDEAGICVMDETNLESHGSWQKPGMVEPSYNVPGNRPEWREACLDRARSMYERDKNHASILWWSCGNESFMGTVIADMCDFFHEKDKVRLVHYEGATYDRSFDDYTDVESRMYATPAMIREYMENDPKKPELMCEYMHDMGNSIGGMESYIKLRDEFPMYQGGFIWDYMDQALYYTNANGQKVLGYGGDFGERPTDYAFSGNGIVFADRTEKPAMQDVRYWYQDEEARKKWDETNRQRSEDSLRKLENEEAFRKQSEKKTLQVAHTDYYLGIKGTDFHYMFSWQCGGPVSFKIKGKEYLYRVPKPAFWRASTENDQGNGFPVASAAWFGAEMFTRAKKCMVYETVDGEEIFFDIQDYVNHKAASENITEVKICCTYEVPVKPLAEITITYIIQGDGQIQVKVNFPCDKDLPQLPLLGMRFVMPERYEEYSWTGLSGETYPDRYKGAAFGTYTDKVETTPYLVPQECKNHMYTHRLQVGGLEFVMNQKPFSCSVLPYTPMELENALHQEELPESLRTVVSILGFMRGVGGIDSWGSNVEDEYQLESGRDYEYSFYIRPVMG